MLKRAVADGHPARSRDWVRRKRMNEPQRMNQRTGFWIEHAGNVRQITFGSDSGKRTYISTTNRITSGDELK